MIWASFGFVVENTNDLVDNEKISNIQPNIQPNRKSTPGVTRTSNKPVLNSNVESMTEKCSPIATPLVNIQIDHTFGRPIYRIHSGRGSENLFIL